MTTNTNATTTTTSVTTATVKTTDTKKTVVFKPEYKRDPAPIAPTFDEMDNYIDDYNAAIESERKFTTLPSLLEKIIRLDQYDLKDFLYSVLTGLDYEVKYADGYLFAKGNIPVMLCAHMDTVHKKSVSEIWMSEDGKVWSPQGIGGDDRCGIYTAMMSIRKDCKPYILFTEDEEIGCVGAGYFEEDIGNGIIDKDDIDIHFIIEVDRRGSEDSVYYSCDNPDFEDFINKFGFKTAWGSCSDISVVAPALGVAAVNLSSGYYNAHTTSEYIVLEELYKTVNRVNEIIREAANGNTVKYEYIESKYTGYGYSKYKGYQYGGYNDYDYSYDNYDYGRKYGKTKMDGAKGFDVEENEIDVYSDMIYAEPLEEGSYIITAAGEMIEADDIWTYFIDQHSKVYKAVGWLDSDIDECGFNAITVPIDATAYTATGNLYRYHESDAEPVYVDLENAE